jgi:hypothetical protein
MKDGLQVQLSSLIFHRPSYIGFASPSPSPSPGPISAYPHPYPYPYPSIVNSTPNPSKVGLYRGRGV